jgi:hypothetical protein
MHVVGIREAECKNASGRNACERLIWKIADWKPAKVREAQNPIESKIYKRASRAIDLRRSIAKIAFARPNLIKFGSKFEQIWSILAIC